MEPSCQRLGNNEFDFVDFRQGSRVLDVGCGSGAHLRELVASGVQACGVDIDAASIARLRAEGLDVRSAPAESLPFPDASFDGILSSVVVPYTDEYRAIAEWSRVLAKDGQVRASFHAPGYGLRMMFNGKECLARRFYGLRMLANTACYGITQRRLPSWLGDTLCQTESRLFSYYRKLGLQVEATQSSSLNFAGLPLFIFHVLRRC
jgi:SAM-dependent methyltransferase